MSTFAKTDALRLSVPERIQLVEDIWDTVAEIPEQVDLTEAQKEELDRRMEAYRRNPDAGSPWDAVRERMRNRR